eukprot:724785-Amphidinium_carterae.1
MQNLITRAFLIEVEYAKMTDAKVLPNFGAQAEGLVSIRSFTLPSQYGLFGCFALENYSD